VESRPDRGALTRPWFLKDLLVISPDKPRRYVIDANGDRIMLGLTVRETIEFEGLDRLLAEDDEDATSTLGGCPDTVGEKRWLELYVKHDTAWRVWSTAARSDLKSGPFPRLLFTNCHQP